MGTLGLKGLFEELEAENEGVKIPSDLRWLDQASDVRTLFQEMTIPASSVTFAILGEATFTRLCKSELRLLGRRYEVKTFEEERPDAPSGRCCEWDTLSPAAVLQTPGAQRITTPRRGAQG